MATYIIMLTLTQEGREKMLQDPQSVTRAETSISIPDVQVLGLYGVLGGYDFIGIVESPDNESMARFSIELGAKAGVHITTMPAIPIARLEYASQGGDDEGETSTFVWRPEGFEVPREEDLSVPPR